MAELRIDPRLVQAAAEQRRDAHLDNDCPECGAPAGEQCVDLKHRTPSGKLQPNARFRLKRAHAQRLP